MSLIARLDELIVGLDAAVVFQLQAIPLAWLVAIGAVAIGSMLLVAVCAALIAGVMRVGGEVGAGVSTVGRDPVVELWAMPLACRGRSVGARGARAPGRTMWRPVFLG